ncbi:MAG: hypothetical protein LUF01_10570 [Bacteroides sp.]|nr:hypothetical protein [Bacteroides sp.]
MTDYQWNTEWKGYGNIETISILMKMKGMANIIDIQHVSTEVIMSGFIYGEKFDTTA